jgi:hypothetical protein
MDYSAAHGYTWPNRGWQQDAQPSAGLPPAAGVAQRWPAWPQRGAQQLTPHFSLPGPKTAENGG